MVVSWLTDFIVHIHVKQGVSGLIYINIAEKMALSVENVQCLSNLNVYDLSVQLGLSLRDLLFLVLKDPTLAYGLLNGYNHYNTSFIADRVKVSFTVLKLVITVRGLNLF